MLQTSAHLKPRTIYRKYVSIKQYCDYLLREQLASEVFFRFSTRRFQLPQTLPRTLQKQEIKALILASEQMYRSLTSSYRRTLCARDIVILELLFCLGLRVSEISNMMICDFHPHSQSILIHGKGSKERLLYIPSATVLNKLNTWLSVRSTLSPASDHIFINRY